jgi:TP901-1 family phage major tail protein
MSAGAGAGALLALRLETATAGSFIDLGGLRTKSFKINNELIDTTNSDSAGRWQERLAATGMRSIEFSGDGVFKDGAANDRLRLIALSDPPQVKCQIFVPTFGTFEGNFMISGIEFGGEHKGEITYSMSAESNGVIVFTNIP